MSVLDNIGTVLAALDTVNLGRTLPRAWYLDKDVYESEREAIFKKSWQYVAHVDELAKPGDFVVAPVGDFTVLVTRSFDGELRAFHNTCQHRGAELALCSSGNTKLFQCLYHGWSYGLDGALVNAPSIREIPEFDLSSVRLPQFKVDTWECFVFVNCDAAAGSLADWLGPLAERTAERGVDYSTLEQYRRIEYDVAANWKVVVENAMECYHCRSVHPQLTDLYTPEDMIIELRDHGYYSGKGDLKRDTEIRDAYVGGGYVYSWPTFQFCFGPSSMMGYRFYPRGVDRTLIVREFYFADGVDEEKRKSATGFTDNVQKQDIPTVEAVQRGLKAGGFDSGQLHIANRGTSEVGVELFDRLYLEYMLAHVEQTATADTGRV